MNLFQAFDKKRNEYYNTTSWMNVYVKIVLPLMLVVVPLLLIIPSHLAVEYDGISVELSHISLGIAIVFNTLYILATFFALARLKFSGYKLNQLLGLFLIVVFLIVRKPEYYFLYLICCAFFGYKFFRYTFFGFETAGFFNAYGDYLKTGSIASIILYLVYQLIDRYIKKLGNAAQLISSPFMVCFVILFLVLDFMHFMYFCKRKELFDVGLKTQLTQADQLEQLEEFNKTEELKPEVQEFDYKTEERTHSSELKMDYKVIDE